jgi:CBS domain containing-hemolysin-like protein
MGEWLIVLAAVLLTVGTALFVAAEFSLVALDRPQVQQAVDSGDARARGVLSSLRALSTQLSAAQVGITVTTLLVGYLAEPSVGRLVRPALAAVLPAAAVEASATAAALLLVTVFSMVFGELVAQFLGISAPLATAKLVARPVQVFALLARPLVAVFNGSANAVLRAVGITPAEQLSGARTPQELASLVRRSAQAGTLDESTALIVTRTLDFGDRTAADVMTPRVRATGIERSASAEDVIELARRSGHSRFPVIGQDWDDIDGVVHVKAAVAVPRHRRQGVPVSALMVPHRLVPETVRLGPLLGQVRDAALQVAVVVDEYGGTSGIVTLEDVVEEIVGEVTDEHDRMRQPAYQLADGAWSVSGMWRPDEVRSRVGAPVPDGAAYESTGGFVMAALGRVPQVGDEVHLPGWTVQVTRLDRRRVARVRLVPTAIADDGAIDGASEGQGDTP